MNPIGLLSNSWRIEGYNYFVNDPNKAIAICTNCGLHTSVNIEAFQNDLIQKCECQFNTGTNERFGKWTVLVEAPRRGAKRYMLCRCDCGQTKEIDYSNLKQGLSNSCGKCKVSKRLTKKEKEDELHKQYLEERKQLTFKNFRGLVERNLDKPEVLAMYREQGLIDENNEIIEAGFEVPQAIIEPRE